MNSPYYTYLLYIFLGIFLLPNSGVAQRTITGKLIDQNTLEGIAAASIIEEGTLAGVFSNINGAFTIQVTSDTSHLIISHISYETQSLSAKDAENIYLLEKQMPIGQSVIISSQNSEKRKSQTLHHLFSRELTRDTDISIAPSLNQVPGVHMQSGTLNTNRIMIRGIGSRSPFSTTKLKAYFNDIPLSSGDGETTIEDIDLSLIDHIEILKGPTASQYGAGLGGMIHLKTKQDGKHNNHILSSNTIGSYGLVRSSNSLRISNEASSHNLRLNVNSTHQTGYRANNEYSRRGMGIIYTYLPSTDHIITALSNMIDVKAFIPSSLNIEDFQNNPSAAATNWASVEGNEDYKKLNLGVSSQKTWNNLGKDQKYILRNVVSLFSSASGNFEVRPFNILDETSLNMGIRNRLRLLNTSDEAFLSDLSVGIELFRELYQWSTLPNEPVAPNEILSDNEEIRSYGNMFFEAKFKLEEKFNLDFGIHINRTQYNYQDFYDVDGDQSANRIFSTIISPRLGINYKIHQQKSHFLYATISHGYSPISLEETLNPSGTINPDIQLEQGWNFEIGVKGYNRIWDYDLSIYSMIVQDLLVARRTAEDQFIGINAGETNHTGIDAMIRYLGYQSSNISITPTINYSFSHHRFVDFVDNDQDYSGNPLTGVAPHKINAIVDFSINKNFYGNINYQYLSAIPLRDDYTVFSDPYQLINLKIGYKKTLYQRLSVDLNAGMRNITNTRYASMVLINARSFGSALPRYYYPGLPRNTYVNLIVKMDI